MGSLTVETVYRRVAVYYASGRGHAPVNKSIVNTTDATGNLARWRLRLSELVFEAVHWAGVKGQAPDALSRLLTTGTDKNPFDNDVAVLMRGEAQP